MEFINSRFTGSVGITGSFIVTGSVDVSGSLTGSLLGTASYALNAGDVFPYSGSAQITGTLFVSDEFTLGEISGSTPFTASQVISSSAADTRLSGSFSGSFYGTFVGVDTTLISSASATASINFDISGSSSLQINTNTVHVSGTFNVSESIRMYQSTSVSGTNIFGTSSWADTASYLNGFIGQGITLPFLTASTTWSINHGLNTLYPLVNVWQSGSEEIIQPDVVESKNLNVVEVRFTVPITGYANVAIAGAPLYQASPFFTASFALTASFVSGGVNVQDSITSSWAATASYVANAVSASYFSGSSAIVNTGSINQLTVTNRLIASYLSTANYADDAAAAAAGVPLYGLYRSGNMVLVRIV